MIEPIDEELHPVGEGERWQESWYFNWADPRHNVFGLTRIGFLFRQRLIDGLVLTIRNGMPEYAYPAVNIRYNGDWGEQTAAGGLHARGLAYRAEEPLKKWRLTLEGRDGMDLLWTAFTPAFDYLESEGGLPPNVAGRHFEQSGRVTGWTSFKGERLEINGAGQRDKSWGVRDWANIEGWNWISAQFGEELSFNIWEGFFDGERYANGFIFHGGWNHPVESVNIQFKWDFRKHVPSDAHLVINYGWGKRLEISAHALGQFPLVKKGLWIQETHADFETIAGGKQIRGIGVIEHAWRAGKFGTLARFHELAGAAARVLRR